MFSYVSHLSHLVGLGPPGRNKSDKEFAAAAAQSAHGPVPPEAPALAVDNRLESLSQRTADSLNAMNDEFNAVLKTMRASGSIGKAEEMQLRSQLDYAVAESFKASSEVTLLRRNSELVRLQFDRPGPAGRGSGKSAAIDGQLVTMMKATANATAALDGMAQTWRALPAAAGPELQSALGNANWHLQALGRSLVASAMAQAVPNSDSRLDGNELHPSTATIRAMVFDSATGVPPALQGYVARMTTSLAHALADPELACVPADERHGIPPGHYPIPAGEPIGRALDDWKDDAYRTFVKDFKRDTIGGGAMTIDGRDVISQAARQDIRSLGEASEKGADASERSAAKSRYDERTDAAANDAIEQIYAAAPPALRDTVLGVVTQRSPLELNARFATSALGVATAAMDGKLSGRSDFAIRTEASHGRPGVIEVRTSKPCTINGIVRADGTATLFDTPQEVTLSGTFEISAAGITVKASSAQAHRHDQS